MDTVITLPEVRIFRHVEGHHVATYVHMNTMFRYAVIPVGYDPHEYLADGRAQWVDSYTLPYYYRGKLSRVTHE